MGVLLPTLNYISVGSTLLHHYLKTGKTLCICYIIFFINTSSMNAVSLEIFQFITIHLLATTTFNNK